MIEECYAAQHLGGLARHARAAARIYQESAAALLPIAEAEFARAIDPVHIVATRKGRGGPQRPEVERMLKARAEQLADHRRWLANTRAALTDSKSVLEGAFARLLP